MRSLWFSLPLALWLPLSAQATLTDMPGALSRVQPAEPNTVRLFQERARVLIGNTPNADGAWNALNPDDALDRLIVGMLDLPESFSADDLRVRYAQRYQSYITPVLTRQVHSIIARISPVLEEDLDSDRAAVRRSRAGPKIDDLASIAALAEELSRIAAIYPQTIEGEIAELHRMAQSPSIEHARAIAARLVSEGIGDPGAVESTRRLRAAQRDLSPSGSTRESDLRTPIPQPNGLRLNWNGQATSRQASYRRYQAFIALIAIALSMLPFSGLPYFMGGIAEPMRLILRLAGVLAGLALAAIIACLSAYPRYSAARLERSINHASRQSPDGMAALLQDNDIYMRRAAAKSLLLMNLVDGYAEQLGAALVEESDPAAAADIAAAIDQLRERGLAIQKLGYAANEADHPAGANAALDILTRMKTAEAATIVRTALQIQGRRFIDGGGASLGYALAYAIEARIPLPIIETMKGTSGGDDVARLIAASRESLGAASENFALATRIEAIAPHLPPHNVDTPAVQTAALSALRSLGAP